MTGKLTTQKGGFQVPEDQIEAYREFSPLSGYPATLNAKENFSDDGWNAYPKFVPKTELMKLFCATADKEFVLGNQTYGLFTAMK